VNRRLVFLLAAAGLIGCDDMSHQRRYDTGARSRLFADGKALQAPPSGTVAQDDPAWAAALRERPEMTAALLHRGQQRYTIFCQPCHDASGDGHGVIPSRGFPTPPSFHLARLRDAPSDYFVQVIGQGHGVMYSYGDRVPPADRWAIAAYVRALQLSRNAPVAQLTADERAKLRGGEP
jgi:mono/diheme cytochrome c family protein